MAEIRFVHFTDPHLFDAEDRMVENEEALQWCIDRVNESVLAGKRYAFVTVTGDLGLEKLSPAKDDPRVKAPAAVAEAAQKLGRRIASSKVPLWLFVPGNNDLVEEDPATIGIYREFIQALAGQAPGITIKDLCPRRGDPRSGYHDVDDGDNRCRFIGFNNASFKSNDIEKNATDFAPTQLEHIAEVSMLLDQESDYQSAWIFYHIA
ncbi:MAG TPA: hypothetical protein VEX38_07495, partial [Fimbriimonadaceae bacterium]|nr:hypothetical protein [Fimbriimonadaceae bacterium]